LPRIAGRAGPRFAVGGLSVPQIITMYKMYILQSLVNLRYYIGSTENFDERLKRHNGGRVKSTKSGKPWKLVYSEKFPTKSEAYKREMEVKSYKGGIKFKKLLGLWKE